MHSISQKEVPLSQLKSCKYNRSRPVRLGHLVVLRKVLRHVCLTCTMQPYSEPCYLFLPSLSQRPSMKMEAKAEAETDRNSNQWPNADDADDAHLLEDETNASLRLSS